MDPLLICAAAGGIAAYTDWRHRKVLNVLTLPLMVCGMAWSVFGEGIAGLTASLQGMLLPLALLPFFAVRMLGAGDVKLLMGLGAWLGPGALLELCAWSILLGGLMAVVVLMTQGGVVKRIERLWNWGVCCLVTRRLQSWENQMGDTPLPFAVAVMGGVVCLVGQQLGWMPVLTGL